LPGLKKHQTPVKTVILSGDKRKLNIREILAFRDLLKNLALRDVTIRYKQTWLGVLWALVRPAFNIVVFGCISMLISRSGNPTAQFLSVGAGMIIWNFMTSCVSDSSNSLLANANLLTKVYFPKLILPLSSVLVCLIDLAISFSIYLIAYIFLKGLPGWEIIFLPVFVLLAIVLCLGFGFMFAALNVKYRDVNFALPFMLQFAFYASPVFLPTNFYLQYLPPVLQKIFLANPLVLILDGFRFCLTGQWPGFDIRYAAVSVALIIIFFVLGIRSFLKFEKSFADYI
jgi:lipopolysaccharide transport system permease protein